MEQQNETINRRNKIKLLRDSMKTSLSILSRKTEHIKNIMDSLENIQEQKNLLDKSNTIESYDDQSKLYHLKSSKTISDFQQKYETLEKIGEGSNGIVHKCIHRKKGIIYAVKSINIDEQHIYFLKKSFYQVKELSHKSIVKYKSLYIDRRKNLCNLVMEYIDWPNLLNTNFQTEAEIKVIMYNLFDSISYMHSKLMCHRDIKPQNILYNNKTGDIKIIDFGISKKLFHRSFNQQMLTFTGTLFYKAPQMFSGGGYSEKIDQWAAGVTLFKLATGFTPFQSEYHSETIENIKKKQINFENPVWQNYSKYVKDLLIRIFKIHTQRLAASQALKHFWFTTQDISPRITKMSRSMTLSEDNKTQNVQIQNKSSQFTGVKIQRLNTLIKQQYQDKDKTDSIVKKWLSNDSNKDNIDSDQQKPPLIIALFSKKNIEE